MTVVTDVEEIQSTKTEKLLAYVLAAFILLGGVWTYQQLDDVIRAHEPLPTQTQGALAIVTSYLLLAYMRRGTSRWLPLAASYVAAATILAFVLAADYLTDYFDPYDWGIAFVALLGILCTLAVYWGVHRYLVQRLPQRRVRRHQCPFCGYPGVADMEARRWSMSAPPGASDLGGSAPGGEGTHCEGCGREVVAPCANCEAPRRVGVAHCAVCGR